jgi:hypothetical protein
MSLDKIAQKEKERERNIVCNFSKNERQLLAKITYACNPLLIV